ncbi:MAG: phosphopantothenoylcysteine decarboxylase / phosphopantothenate---cysteine ligase [Clostridiales bacterium]|nr:phosphopantothenoylcysteine decarboxylase / phosphopantothenate---cysteine ligase [Clostridiales bacterium]
MLSGKNIVVGVTGGIAAYKAADVVSRLKKLDANVYVIMTKHATEFIQPLTFQSLSQNYVVTEMFEDPKTWDVEHISLAKRADLFLIVPATANIIGKVANGIADDMLTTTVMATEAPVFFALAMNTKMYQNKITQSNFDRLMQFGYHMIWPDSGRLACGDVGAGKLAAPESIVEIVEDYLNRPKRLSGKKVVVTAGPTREAVDPVRFISNRSSGKMGYAIAEAAVKEGATVVLISGPTRLNPPIGVDFTGVTTTEEMYEAVFKNADADIIIKAAAPSDYRPVEVASEKIKKESGQLALALEKTPDILKALGLNKRSGQFLVGFAAETQNVETYALKKLKEKNLDMIVANNVAQQGAGFDGDTNIVTIYERDGSSESLGQMEKSKIAEALMDRIILRTQSDAKNE